MTSGAAMLVLVNEMVCDLSTNGPCTHDFSTLHDHGNVNLSDAEHDRVPSSLFFCVVVLLIAHCWPNLPLFATSFLRSMHVWFQKVFSLTSKLRSVSMWPANEVRLNSAHGLRAGFKHPAFASWLARCKQLGIATKTAKRLWQQLLRGLVLANLQKLVAAERVFDDLARQVVKLCPRKIRFELDRSTPVLWSGASAKLAAQHRGYTMEQCALGLLLDNLPLLDNTQPDAWQTLKPLWAAFSRCFVKAACESPGQRVLVCLSKSSQDTIFMTQELPLLLKAGIEVDYEVVLPDIQCERLCLLQALAILQSIEGLL